MTKSQKKTPTCKKNGTMLEQEEQDQRNESKEQVQGEEGQNEVLTNPAVEIQPARPSNPASGAMLPSRKRTAAPQSIAGPDGENAQKRASHQSAQSEANWMRGPTGSEATVADHNSVIEYLDI